MIVLDLFKILMLFNDDVSTVEKCVTRNSWKKDG